MQSTRSNDLVELRKLRGLVIDMDGVLWHGDTPMPGLLDFFNILKQRNIQFVLATNNNTQTPGGFAQKTRQLGVDVQADQVVTAATATVHYLCSKYPSGSRIYVVGEFALKGMISDAGFVMADTDVCAVIATMDRQFTYDMLKRATLLIRAGADFIGPNPDTSYPTPKGIVQGGGSILAAIAAASNRQPLIIGKPESWMFKMCLERMGLDVEEVASLGDRLTTDILGGQRVGMKTILVLKGFDVTITGDLNGVPFTCGDSCGLPLPEGLGAANYTMTSTSGRTASGSSAWQRDRTPPDLAVNLPPVDGRNGWYVSEVDLSATAADAISGLSILNGSLDGGTTWISFPVHFTDRNHLALIHTRDVAGNEVTISRRILVDTVAPIVQITSHTNGDVVQGDVRFSGSLEDLTSGPKDGEISIYGGNTWQPVLLEAGNWSFVWRSGEALNGEYTIQMHGLDRAGNDSNVSTFSLTVDNAPPAVSITEWWWIWETGTLKVSSNHFPIAIIQVTIRDPQNRWQKVELSFNPGMNTYLVKWDRRFGDGTLAPSGEYPVLALACDVNGLCGQDASRIVIPYVATSTATITPSPTATSIVMSSATPTMTQMVPTPTLVLNTPIPEEIPVLARSSLPLWQIIGLLGLFMVIASASVVDPRPKALERLSETLKMMSEWTKDYAINNK